MTLNKASIIVCTLFSLLAFNAHANDHDHIEMAVNDANRNIENKARDIYRHPQKTLQFFGIKPDMQVLEILPGRGWYTEILAPLLKDQGQLTIAHFGENHPNEHLSSLHKNMMQMMAASPNVYGKVKVVNYKESDYLSSVPDASQDMVLTFRSSHNWLRNGGIEDIYASFHRVLKPGGILGVVKHRASKGSDPKKSAEQGYVPESYLIRLVENAGFELTGASEINANPKDSHDHPEGVWTLPPTLRLGNIDKEKYLAIGESDRMTLRFVKQ